MREEALEYINNIIKYRDVYPLNLLHSSSSNFFLSEMWPLSLDRATT